MQEPKNNKIPKNELKQKKNMNNKNNTNTFQINPHNIQES